jgi:hypothetical protein
MPNQLDALDYQRPHYCAAHSVQQRRPCRQFDVSVAAMLKNRGPTLPA